MKIMNHELGEIEAGSSSFLHLPEGLLGFESHQKYTLLSLEEYLPFRWLVSKTDPDLAFVVASPEYFTEEPYPLTLGGSDAELLDLHPSDALEVYVIVSPAEGGRGVTADLKGPLVVNSRTRLAKQILLYSSRLSVRQPMRYPAGADQVLKMGRTVVRIAGRRVA